MATTISYINVLILKIGLVIKKHLVVYHMNVRGLITFTMNSDMSILSVKSVKKLKFILGGLTVDKPVRKMWVGVSITMLVLQTGKNVPSMLGSIKTIGTVTMHQ